MNSKDNIRDLVAQTLGTFRTIQLAVLFGSFATGRQSPTSDLDVAVAAERPLGVSEKMALIDALAQRFGRPVDLVDLNRETGTILHQAMTRGVVLLNRDPLLYARIILRMLYDQADMMPLRTYVDKARLRTFAHG